jgi:hypothetical protein
MPQPTSYAKCSCQHCGGHIEFPAEGAGQVVKCPHCGWDTFLTVSHPAQVEVGGGAAVRKRIFLLFGIVAVVVALTGLGAFLYVRAQSRAVNSEALKPGPRTNTKPLAAEPNSTPPSTPAPDPWHGLKAGPVKLEKTGDGRLVYAVGTVQNQSARQRFGVKVNLDILDTNDNRVGSATDYAQVIEPDKEWKFKALVTDRTGAKAKLINITEQE